MHAFSAYQLSVKKIWITEKICTSSTSLTKTRYFHFQWCHFSSVTIPLILSFLFCDLCLLKPYIILPLPFLLIHPLLLLSLLDHCSSGGVYIFHIPPTPTLSLWYATGDLTGSLFLITNKSISFQFWYCQIRYIQPN